MEILSTDKYGEIYRHEIFKYLVHFDKNKKVNASIEKLTLTNLTFSKEK